MMKKMLAIILFLAVFSSFFAFQGAASEEEFSDEETKAVITAAVNAHKLYALAKWRMVDAIVTPEDESAEDRIQNAITLDPVFSELIENDKLYRKADFGFENDYVYYYRAKESIGSLKDLQMFFDRRFTDFDVETQYPNKLYFFDGNRLYLSTNTGFWGFGGCEYFDYASLSVKRIDSDHAVVVIPHKNGTYPEENYYEDTLFMAKTETGWKAESVNPANAPETGDPSTEELALLVKNSILLHRVLYGGYRDFVFGFRNRDVDEFIIQNGYNTENEEMIEIPDIFGKRENGKPIETRPGYAYSEKMNSLQRWEEEIKKYFTKDLFGFTTHRIEGVENMTSELYEYEGRTYAFEFHDSDTVIQWDKTEVRILSENRAEAVVHWTIEGWGDGTNNVLMRKTDDGWRVYGGDYFGENIVPDLPETGDNTAIFAVCSVVALAALAAVCVKASRRRRETA